MSQDRNKNLRLSFEAWQALRKLKFALNASSYSEVLDTIYNFHNGKLEYGDIISEKKPTDAGDTGKKSIDRSDKTIVINSEMHSWLQQLKNEYILEMGLASRGPNAISISTILLDLLKNYKQSKNI